MMGPFASLAPTYTFAGCWYCHAVRIAVRRNFSCNYRLQRVKQTKRCMVRPGAHVRVQADMPHCTESTSCFEIHFPTSLTVHTSFASKPESESLDCTKRSHPCISIKCLVLMALWIRTSVWLAKRTRMMIWVTPLLDFEQSWSAICVTPHCMWVAWESMEGHF